MATIKERNGSYQITVSCGYDIQGKHLRETITFTPEPGLTPKKREKAVEDFARKFEEDVKNGIALDGRKITLKAFADRWLSEYAVQKLAPKTLEDYTNELNKRILPALGHMRLAELRPAILNGFFVGMTKDGARRDGKPSGYSRATIKKTQDVPSSVLRTATEWETIGKNPMDKVQTVGERAADKLEFVTPEQAAAFLDYIERPYIVKTRGHNRTDDTGMLCKTGA